MAGLHFTNVVTLGSLIVGGLVTISGLAIFLYGVRWKSAWRVASTQAHELRLALDDERDRADRAQKREMAAVERLEAALRDLAECRATTERLEALPNLERVINLMAQTAERSEERFQARISEHDRLAEERHRDIIAAVRDVTAALQALEMRMR